MRLTARYAKARQRHSSGFAASRALTTEPGFTNPNKQVVEARTGISSSARDGQVIYRMRCIPCNHIYGCNGLDIKSRLCPACQHGAPGEKVVEGQPTLFG